MQTSRTRPWFVRLAAVALVVAPVAVSTGASVAAAAPATGGGGCKNDPGVSADTIKVGVIAPTSGPQAQSFGAAVEGIQARFDVANENDELGGRKVEVVVADDVGDTARNLTAAQQLVEQDDVFGIVELSSAADGSAQYLNAQKIPVTGWHVGVAAWGKYKNMFSWRNSQPPEPAETFVTRQADLLKKLGNKKIAIVGTNVQASATFVDQISESVKKTKPLQVVYTTTDVTPADREFTGIAQAIKDSGADALYTGMDLTQNAALNAALRQAGSNVETVVLPGGYDDRVLGLDGMDGVLFGIEFKPFELDPPAFAEYKAAMEAADKHVFGQVPYYGWLSADAFVRGVQAAGVKCPTRAAFIKNLRKVRGYDANGAFQPVDFKDIFGRPFYCVYYVKVVNGAFEPQFNGEPFCTTRVIDHGKVKKLDPAVAAKG